MNSCPGSTNHRTLVKICGLRRPQDAEAANRVLPDFAGFYSFTGIQALDIAGAGPHPAEYTDHTDRIVEVFVDEPLENLIRIAAAGIDMIHCTGMRATQRC